MRRRPKNRTSAKSTPGAPQDQLARLEQRRDVPQGERETGHDAKGPPAPAANPCRPKPPRPDTGRAHQPTQSEEAQRQEKESPVSRVVAAMATSTVWSTLCHSGRREGAGQPGRDHRQDDRRTVLCTADHAGHRMVGAVPDHQDRGGDQGDADPVGGIGGELAGKIRLPNERAKKTSVKPISQPTRGWTGRPVHT